MTVYVYLWFDIEDYVTKESDGLVLKALEILRKYRIPVTCKVVAEKARALLANGRSDVIDAISGCDVGYHTDTHSRHPTVYEYIAKKNVLEGAEDFYAREGAGLQLVKRTFKTELSCFGHPGKSWAPHYYPALKRMGIPVYLDETPILDTNGAPYWYCGILNLNATTANFILFDRTFEDAKGIFRVKAQFKQMHDHLQANGGVVSILFHLHTAINKKFWDEVNFGRGKNRSPSKYVRPPAQPSHVTDRAWRDFEEFVRYVSSFEDVRFITARDAVKMYKRPSPVEVDLEALKVLAKGSRRRIDVMRVGGYTYSPAQVFSAVAIALREYKETRRVPRNLMVGEPLGPMEPRDSEFQADRRIPKQQFLEACAWTADYVETKSYMPSYVGIARGARLAPADFLSTASSVLTDLLSTGSMPAEVRLAKGTFLGTRYVSEEGFRFACKWSVLPPRFMAPAILDQIKLQTWTLVPAGTPGPLQSACVQAT